MPGLPSVPSWAAWRLFPVHVAFVRVENKETQAIERQKHRGEERDRDRSSGRGGSAGVGGAGPGRQGQVWDPAFGIVTLSQVSLQP